MLSALRSAVRNWARAISGVVSDRGFAIYDLGAFSLKYRIDSYDRYIIEEVWKKDEYFLDGMTLAVEGWIVDVGAHIGGFAVRARSKFPTNPILAVEPVPANFRLLKHNLARNHARSVTPRNVALMATPGKTAVYLDPANTAGHSTVAHVSSAMVSARAITIEELFRQHHVTSVAFLKIDCEGAEYQIVLNSPDELWQRVSNLAVEYHPIDGHDFQQLRTCLESRGLEMTAHKDGYFAGQGTALFQKPSLTRVP
jgi:FkbM family methyltransferase